MHKEEKNLEDAIVKKIFEWDIKLDEKKPIKQVRIAEVGSARL